jgi:carboxymethylenebutenolidase
VSDTILAETTTITGHGGDPIEAYHARPAGDGRYPGVVVIHHMPGYDDATKEIALRFARHGYAALCPNLHYRDAPGASPDDAAAASRAAGGVPDDRLVGDVDGAARFLRGQQSNGRVGVIGYCSGGRQAVLAACRVDLDAAVDCYGAFVVGSPPPELPVKIGPLVHLLPDLSCPLLGLFGREDTHPSPAEVAELERELKTHGKDFEFHLFDNAGHGFFATDRVSYRPEAAAEGWRLIWDFFGRHLAG